MYSNIITNQIGFTPRAAKTGVAAKRGSGRFALQTIDPTVTWKTVLEGELQPEGDHWTGDFSAVTAPGDYRLIRPTESGGTAMECPDINFVIRDGVYSHITRMITEFFRRQRCGDPEGWAGLCHQEPASLVGTDRHLDVRGGYHQSGDLRCWADGVSCALYGYLRFAEKTAESGNAEGYAAEIRRGCDYFLKIIAPEGFIYDCQFVPIGWGPRDYYNGPTNLGAHYSICRMLARASVFFHNRDDRDYARKLLDAAVKIWQFTATAPQFDSPYRPPVENLPPGTQGASFYFQTCRGSAVAYAGSCAAALDLFLASGDPVYRDAAFTAGNHLAGLQLTSGGLAGAFRNRRNSGDLGFADCSYNFNAAGPLVFPELLDQFPEERDSGLWLDTVRRHAGLLTTLYETASFEYIPLLRRLAAETGTHPQWRGDSEGDAWIVETSAAGLAMSHALFLLRSARWLAEPDAARKAAQRCVDFIFGCNPSGASFVTGAGYGHRPLPVYGQFFPSTPQIPGGVVHVLDGEYDLPAGGMLLWALAELPGSPITA